MMMVWATSKALIGWIMTTVSTVLWDHKAAIFLVTDISTVAWLDDINNPITDYSTEYLSSHQWHLTMVLSIHEFTTVLSMLNLSLQYWGYLTSHYSTEHARSLTTVLRILDLSLQYWACSTSHYSTGHARPNYSTEHAQHLTTVLSMFNLSLQYRACLTSLQYGACSTSYNSTEHDQPHYSTEHAWPHNSTEHARPLITVWNMLDLSIHYWACSTSHNSTEHAWSFTTVLSMLNLSQQQLACSTSHYNTGHAPPLTTILGMLHLSLQYWACSTHIRELSICDQKAYIYCIQVREQSFIREGLGRQGVKKLPKPISSLWNIFSWTSKIWISLILNRK